MRFWTPRSLATQPHIGVVITSYLPGDARRQHALMSLVYAFKAQTYSNWSAKVAHDGPLEDEEFKKRFLAVDPARLDFLELPRLQQHGHPHRRPVALRSDYGETKDKTPDWILFTNDDNYYAPVFFESLLHMAAYAQAQIVYCNMVHSHRQWQPLICQPRRGRIDVGSFLVTRQLVDKVPWLDFGFAGDGSYFEALAAQAQSITVVPGFLFVHN